MSFINRLELVSTKYLFLNGLNGELTIDLDADQISCLPNQILSLNLTDLSVTISQYFINDDNNVINFKNTVTNTTQNIIIPPGTYMNWELAETITRLYPTCNVTYDFNKNKFIFNFTDNHEIEFQNISAYTFGFSILDNPSGTTITSTKQIDPRNGVNNIVVRLDGIQCYGGNLDNFTDNTVQPSNILGLIPLTNTDPFTTIQYTSHDNIYEIYIDNNKIDKFRITFTDNLNNVLKELKTFTLSIRINTYKFNENRTEKLIESLLNHTKLNFLSNQLNK